MAAQKYAIKETKEMLDFVLAGVDAGTKVMADGKVDLQDLAPVMAVVPLIQPAFDKWNEIPKEMGDLDAPESAEIVAHIATKLNVSDKKAKIYIEYGLKIAHKAYLIFVDVKDMREALAAPVA